MSRAVEVAFQYAEADFTSAMRLYLARRLKPKQAIAMAAVLLIGSVVLMVLGKNVFFSALIVVVAGAMLALQGLALLFWPRWIYRREPSFREQFRLRFSNAGICFVAEDDEIDYSWSMYSDLLENERVFVLMSTEAMFTAIPRSAFPNEAAERAFESLARECLGLADEPLPF
jgi:hypothetical protein